MPCFHIVSFSSSSDCSVFEPLRFELCYDAEFVPLLQDLLLLCVLTRANTNIQKIVAFENGFERLFDIVREEGNSDGGEYRKFTTHF